MARKLTQQEELDRAKLRLQLLAERSELQAELARRNTGGLPQGALKAMSRLPGGAWLGIGGAGLLAVIGGVLVARQPKLRSAALVALIRFLTR